MTRFFFALLMLAPVALMAQQRYDNPVDHQTYSASGAFRTYQPAVPRNTDGQRVMTERLILLTGEEDLKTRVTVADLVAFGKSAENVVYPELAKNAKPMALLLQFNCLPGKFDVQMSSQGDAEQEVLQKVYDAVKHLPPLAVSGEVRFQLQIRVKS